MTSDTEWAGKNVLVTGAGGFIGSHLCRVLVQRGATVTAFVRYTSRGSDGLLALNEPEVRAAVRIVRGDLTDPMAVRNAVARQEIVFHLGALIAIPYSYVNPVEVTAVNVMGTLNVLNAARDANVTRVVHTSTSETYGTAQTVPIAESHPIAPQSPYAAAKVGADALARSFHLSFGLPVATIRPFNTYGPRQSARAVIPTIVGQALWADRIKLGSLTPTRDFTYVADTVEGFLAVARAPAAVGRVLNVGSGKEISIGQLVEKIKRIVGRDLDVDVTEDRKRPTASEVNRLLCDSSEAQKLTGWAPRVPLGDGLRSVVDFMRSHPDWTRPDRYEV